MAKPSLHGGFDLAFAEQIAFFRQKLNLPTERWNDIEQAAHDRAFIVAGATKADLLADLRQAVDKAISQGTTLETFRKDFRRIVADNGWQGWTGEGTPGGFAWRTKVIYETNLRSSYAAGRWAQLNDPAFQKLMPYWEYRHSESVLYPRPLHQSWHGLTLPAAHPFWKTHFPPNGWGCRCRVVARLKPAKDAITIPPSDWERIDERTGAPIGIDKGWAYAPGANVITPLRSLIEQKLIKVDAPIGAAMAESMAPVIARETAEQFAAWVDDVIAAGVSRGLHAVVGAMTPAEVTHFASATGAAPTTAEIAIDDRLLVGRKAERHERSGNALSPEEWKSIPQALQEQRKAYFDKQDGKMLYVLPSLSGDSIKLAVQVDFMTGHPKRAMNLARAGFRIDAFALRDRKRYEEIE